MKYTRSTLTECSAWKRIEQQLPGWENINILKILDSFFEEMVGLEIPIETLDWLGSNWLYYKPDSKDSIRPYKAYIDNHEKDWQEGKIIHRYNLDAQDNKLYTRLEALKIWRDKGGEYMFYFLGLRIMSLMKDSNITRHF